MNEITHTRFPRPVEGDCPPYCFRYTDKVPDTDIVMYLTSQHETFGAFLQALTADQLKYKYAPGKWSLAEMIGHLLDSERVFAYRMMCISRGEQNSLPGFEQDDYVTGSNYNDLTGEELLAEWNAVRTSTILLCKHMNEHMASLKGKANDSPVKVSALPWMMAGHVNHHLEVASERYGLVQGLIKE